MLVYTRIEGETAPEAQSISGPQPTVADLIASIQESRAANHRSVELVLNYSSTDEPLDSVGIRNGDLVMVRALGEPVPPPSDLSADEHDYTVTTLDKGEDETAARSRRRRRLPEYDQLTKDLQWHAPFHIDGSRPAWQVWDDRHSKLQCVDWEAYRAPDKLYYRTYTAMQAKADRAVSTVFEFTAENDGLRHVSPERVEKLRAMVATLGFPEWGLCIMHQHVTRFALSSWIAGAAQFVMFDQLRHAQLYGRLTLAYGEAHSGFESGHEQWMAGARFQPVRMIVEEMLAFLDWGKEMIVAGIFFEPIYSAVVHGLMQEDSLQNGDGLAPIVCQSVGTDKRRHRAAAVALLNLVCSDTSYGEQNRVLVSSWAEEWIPRVAEACLAWAEQSVSTSARVLEAVEWINRQLDAAGLTTVDVSGHLEPNLETA